ncbi:hypothetical protein LXL04_014646 [Taraxacum kok-saghyz]
MVFGTRSNRLPFRQDNENIGYILGVVGLDLELRICLVLPIFEMEMTDVQDLVGIEMLDIEILEPTMELEMVVDADVRFQEFLDRHKKIKDKDAHNELRNALIEHLWDEYVNSGTSIWENTYNYLPYGMAFNTAIKDYHMASRTKSHVSVAYVLLSTNDPFKFVLVQKAKENIQNRCVEGCTPMRTIQVEKTKPWLFPAPLSFAVFGKFKEC